MTAGHAVAFLLFAVVAAGTPGPSNVLLTATGANVGVVRGLPCLFGVTIGMGVMLAAVTAGLGGVVLANPLVMRALHWAGAAFLLWLAWKIASSRSAISMGDARPVGFGGAAAFQWVNPKSWLVCASAAGTYLRPEAGGAIAQAVLLGALFVVAASPSCFVWLAFGASAQRFLRSPRALRAFNIAMGALLAASVVLILS
jgi:threonine/homoserine/homoserine lactone efflux protein